MKKGTKKVEGDGVLISHPCPFKQGQPQSVYLGETHSYSITLMNTTSKPIPLPGMNIICSKPAGSFSLSLSEPGSVEGYIQRFMEGFSLDEKIIQPQTSTKVWLTCKPSEIGLHTFILHFDVGGPEKRLVECIVFLLAEERISRSFRSKNEYIRLPKFEIPVESRKLIVNGHVPSIVTGCLTKKNYAEYFTALLTMEELHLEGDMRVYDMDKISLEKRGSYLLALDVEGLAERRPSLLQGDIVVMKPSNLQATNSSTPVYEGNICNLEANAVVLWFDKKFHSQHKPSNLYNVQFMHNRVQMRRLYQAVEAAGSLDSSILFPSRSISRPTGKTDLTLPFTHLNEQQQRSVNMILRCQGGPPYVIYGPPGTGKTKTVVEAILQIYKTSKNARILVCAASNTAADDMLEKIVSSETVKVKDHQILRLNARSRSYEDVQQSNIGFCYFEDHTFTCPPLKALKCYRIIISTYMSSSHLYAQGITRGHFSHIFLDEAGQVSEPDAMVPLSSLCQRETVVVLAGDPKQLGPVVFSKDAVTYGLGKSYLERLFEYDPYQNKDQNFVTKLVKNYRCHPAILELPSKFFYEGELIACKNDASSRKKNWLNILPNKEFPLLFYGIQGRDEREKNNPSWFNQIEVNKVVELIKILMKTSKGLLQTEIGVITPYRQQVAKISKALEILDLKEVKVGSIEQFQGQEREIIIVSTVRATHKYKSHDKTYSLGFLSNPRRFNVAVTRAKSLLIIVGDPDIVHKDQHWGRLLWYCYDNGSYQGCPLPERVGP